MFLSANRYPLRRNMRWEAKNIMSWLPGWNSIEGSARWGDILFWAGFAFLVLLAGCVVMSKVYGWRKDALIVMRGQLIAIAQELETQQAPPAQPEPQRRDAEAAVARASEGRQPDRVARVQERPSRGLTEAQKKSVIGALAPFRGQKFSVACIADDPEGKSFAGDIVTLLRAAGWDFPESVIAEATYSKEPIGLSVVVNTGQTVTPSVLRPTSMLVKAFADVGLMPRDATFADPNVPRDRIEILVGRNRSSP